MKGSRFAFGVVLALLAAGLAAQSPGQPRPLPLKTKVGTFPLGIETDYLGMAGPKTVVRFRLTAPELSREAAARGVKGFAGRIKGGFRVGGSGGGQLRLSDQRGHDRWSAVCLFLPAVDSSRKPIGCASCWPIPTAAIWARARSTCWFRSSEPRSLRRWRRARAARCRPPKRIVIAEEAAEKPAAPDNPKLKIIPPSREAPIGLLRLEAVVAPPIEKVEFYLEEKRLVTRTKPPYSVEIDLGDVPRRQTVRAVGYDDTGRVIDEDAYAINQGKDHLVVRLLPRPDPAAGQVRVKVVVQSIGGGVAKSLELFLDEKKIASWTAPPYEATIPMAQWARGNVLRATAISADGQEANDIRMLKGPRRRSRAVRVDVVQLHVSALDKGGRFVKGLVQGGLRDPRGRQARGDDRLRDRREPAADDRARRGRIRIDGEEPAVRARGVGRPLQEPHPPEGPGLRHRVQRQGEVPCRT